MVFSTRVHNIPCQCKVIYSSSIHNKTADPEFEFIILDRKGYEAPWLEQYVNDHTVQRLYQEYVNQ